MPRAYRPLPSQERLKELFDYRPETGELIRRVRTSNNNKAGDVVGCLKRGYQHTRVDWDSYTNHRLIWRWMTGEDPGLLAIDHSDRNPSNNRWSNLRLATDSENNHNTPKHKDNTSGFKGVFFSKRRGRVKRWRASIANNGKRHHLGLFHTPEEAHAAYAEAAARLHGDFARLG